MFGFSPGELTALFAVLSTPVASLMVFAKWWIDRIDARNKEEDQEIKDARTKLETRLGDLENIVKLQGSLINKYIQHQYRLEEMMKANGLTPPAMDIPPEMKVF